MKKSMTIGIMLAGILAVAGTGIVSAQGRGWFGGLDPEEMAARQEEKFQTEAEVLGLDTEAIKDAWAEGKNFHELAEEQGISQEELQAKMQAQHQERHQEMLQAMVQNGTISQEQADAKLQQMEECQESGDCNGPMGRGMGGKGMSRGGLGGCPLDAELNTETEASTL